MAEGLGVTLTSWNQFVERAKESFERSVLIKADQSKLQEAVDEVLRENQSLRDRLADIAKTVVGERECTEEPTDQRPDSTIEAPRNHTKY